MSKTLDYSKIESKQKSIAILLPFFGNPSPFFLFWLKSAKNNSSIDFFILTDSAYFDAFAGGNIHVAHMTIAEMKKRFKKISGFDGKLENPYKKYDYRPIFGLLFQDIIEGYDFWGHTDIGDQIYGDLRSFIDNKKLETFDKLFIFGHFVLYKNCKEVNERPLLPITGDFIGYPYVYKTNLNVAYDEIGMPELYKQHHFKQYRGEDVMADIWPGRFVFTTTHGEFKERQFVCLYENSKTYVLYLSNNILVKQETFYIHFQKRKMKLEKCSDSDRWLIFPNQIIDGKDISETQIKDLLMKLKDKRTYKIKWNINETKRKICKYLEKIKLQRLIQKDRKNFNE